MAIHLIDLYILCREIKGQIKDDYRAFDDDEIPGIQLTVGANDDLTDWDYQTGDNCYSGNAYFYPYWAVVGVYRNSNCRELAREIKEQLEDLIALS